MMNFHCPEMRYTGDNAAMIGTAAYFRWKNMKNKKDYSGEWKNMTTDANLKL